MMQIEPDLSRMVIVVSILFLLWIWCLWRELPDDTAFDGVDHCPPDTYTVLEDRNTKVRCFRCPICAAGKEPSPPCGITLATKVVGECTPCKPESFSDEHGIAACKLCTECGSQMVINSCTTTKDTECNECPFAHYKDDSTRTCKHCSSCCNGGHSAPKLTCLMSKRCTENCLHQAKSGITMTKRDLEDPYNTASTDKGDSLRKGALERSNLLEVKFASKRKRLPRSKENQGVNPKLTERNYRDGQPENSVHSSSIDEVLLLDKIKDLELSESPGSTNHVLESTSLLSMDKNVTTVVAESPSTTGSKYKDREVGIVPQPTVLPTTAKRDLVRLSPIPLSTPVTTANAQLISTSSILDNFLGTSAALFLFGFVGVIIYIAYRKFCPQAPTEYKTLSGKENKRIKECEDNDLVEEEEESVRRLDVKTSEICDKATATRIVNDLSLSEIPQDLEDVLVMKLDAPSEADSESYGWQRVGREFGVSRDELNYFKIEYLRDNGSPTKLLLDKLGCQGKTISDLIVVLQSSRVEFHGVAKLIIQRLLITA